MVLIASLVFFSGIAFAQSYPILDGVADKVIQKYQTSTCAELWMDKSKPKPELEERLVQLLRTDPQARQYFINKVAAPIANKMFECGMIP
jgi:hypothetical protein